MTPEELLKQVGPLMSESMKELETFETPEEGFFFAFRMMDHVLKQLASLYTSADVIKLVLERVRHTNNEQILSHQVATIRSLEQKREVALASEIVARLEAVETNEDVDLSQMKKRAAELGTLLSQKHGLDLLERAIKANILEGTV